MSDLIKHYRQLVGIANSWAAKNLPGWSEDAHRDLLARHGAAVLNGHYSSTTMNLEQLGAVLDDYARRGWPRQHKYTPKHADGRARTVPPHISHIVRLWGKLGQSDKVRNASRPALLAFCARQTGRESVPDLDSLTAAEGQAITEALKSWLAR